MRCRNRSPLMCYFSFQKTSWLCVSKFWIHGAQDKRTAWEVNVPIGRTDRTKGRTLWLEQVSSGHPYTHDSRRLKRLLDIVDCGLMSSLNVSSAPLMNPQGILALACLSGSYWALTSLSRVNQLYVVKVFCTSLGSFKQRQALCMIEEP